MNLSNPLNESLKASLGSVFVVPSYFGINPPRGWVSPFHLMQKVELDSEPAGLELEPMLNSPEKMDPVGRRTLGQTLIKTCYSTTNSSISPTPSVSPTPES